MSYDVYLDIDTGGATPATVCDIGNYTSNVSDMWTTALGYPLAQLDGRQAADATPDIRSAAWRMAGDPDQYKAMNPSNGWGDYEGARHYLIQLLEACLAHPKSTIRVSR